MRTLKIATAVMGVMILLGTAGLVVMILKRGAGASGSFVKGYDVILNEPEGTGIAAVMSVRDQLALHLRGGGPDRIVVIDPGSGAVTGQVRLGQVRLAR